MMDFEIEGHKITERGVFIVDDEFSLIIGMNVVQACLYVVFNGPEVSLSYSCQNLNVQRAWREAFAVCRKTDSSDCRRQISGQYLASLPERGHNPSQN